VEEEPPPPEQDSIPALVSRLIDNGEEFVRAELKLYRARVFSRIDEARNAIILGVLALSLVQAVMVAALVGLLIVLTRLIGPGGATAIVVAVGLALAALLALLAYRQLRKATEIKDKDRPK
jgi:LytS/YehU family sensor histidine kinase